MSEFNANDSVRATDRAFASALTEANAARLEELLTPDFVLIDVLSGSKIKKQDLLPLVASGVLKFDVLNSNPEQVLDFGNVAAVVGSSRMAGSYERTPFEAKSRYTHLFLRTGERWKIALAQGTRIPE